MKCILHIGSEKTGTTTFQKWMDNNSSALKDESVFYSKCLGRPNNIIAHLIAAEKYVSTEQYAFQNIFNQDDLDALKIKIRQDLLQELSKIPQPDNSTYVISNEHLQSRIYNVGDIANLKNFLLEYFDEIEVICFLRPQAEVLISRFSTRSRTGSKITSKSLSNIQNQFYDYLALYQRWVEVYGTITLVPFVRNKDVIKYFCDMLDIDRNIFNEIPRANSALDYRTIAFKNAANLPLFRDGKINKNREDFTEDLTTITPLILGQKDIDTINRQVFEKNKKLAEICETVTLKDLSPDSSNHPEVGNIHLLDEPTLFDDRLGGIITRMNVELWMERTRTKHAEAERAIARHNPKKARQFLTTANRFLNHASEADLDITKGKIKRLRATYGRILSVLEI